MGLISIKQHGDFNLIDSFLKRIRDLQINSILEKYGQAGVDALMEATPKRSGRTSQSWSYEVEKKTNGWSIHWINNNVNQGANIAVLIQTGHGTGRGTYVQGTDYINPALRPVFEEIVDNVWKEVISL